MVKVTITYMLTYIRLMTFMQDIQHYLTFALVLMVIVHGSLPTHLFNSSMKVSPAFLLKDISSGSCSKCCASVVGSEPKDSFKACWIIINGLLK